MSDLKFRQEKLQQSRKNTDYNDYLKSIASWAVLNFNNVEGKISKYPNTYRINGLIDLKDFHDHSFGIKLDYDFNFNFFENFNKLFLSVKMPLMVNINTENSQFADMAFDSKNVYLSIGVGYSENVMYSFNVANSKNVYNSIVVFDNNENVYSSRGVMKSFNIFYSAYIYNCSNLWFCTNMIGCTECMFCDGLENKSYCINNKEYSKEDYIKLKIENLKLKNKFQKWYEKTNPKGFNMASEYVMGNFVIYSNNIENGSYVYQGKTGRNLISIGGTGLIEHSYDCFSAGAPSSVHMYGIMGAGDCEHIYNGAHLATCNNVYYSYYMVNCNHCLGCIGLQKKEYCIFNKEYSKEEWYQHVDKIFEQMEKDGILGQFLPANINPFYFNDTFANIIGDFDKKEIISQGYMWRDEKIKVDIPEGASLISASSSARNIKSLSDYQGFDEYGIRQINPEILKKVIVDEKGNYYRVVKMEYDFLMKHGLPIPEIHWLERIKLGFKFN